MSLGEFCEIRCRSAISWESLALKRDSVIVECALQKRNASKRTNERLAVGHMMCRSKRGAGEVRMLARVRLARLLGRRNSSWNLGSRRRRQWEFQSCVKFSDDQYLMIVMLLNLKVADRGIATADSL